jgi:hypothetical protein
MAFLIENVLKYYYYFLNNKSTSENHLYSYLDFLDSEKNYLASTKYEKDKEYWENIFNTPIEYIDIRKGANLFDTKSLRKSYNVPMHISKYCAAEKVSPFSLFFAAFSLYLGRIYNTKEIILGTPVLNRTNFAEKNTSGMFIATLPFRQKINDLISANDFIQEISINQIGLLRHQKYPYSQIQDYYAQKFGRSNNLYDIIFSYQNARTKNNDFDLDFESEWVFTERQADAQYCDKAPKKPH